MRKRLLILAAGVVLLALGGAVAVFIVVNRPPSPGGLETAPTDVEIVTSTIPKPKPIKRPPPAEKVDNRCWKMFGGGPTRSLARPLIHLGIPVKPPLWARGLQSYVEYPPSYCDGVPLRQHLQGRHLGDQGQDRQGDLAAAQHGARSRRRPRSAARS